MKNFTARINSMNAMYKLPRNHLPTISADVAERLAKFKRTLAEEVDEIDDLVFIADLASAPPEAILTGIADLLGDVVVYCFSEALKYGIPLGEVLNIIMDSNESKLGADGNPLYNDDGKFLKGPNYWKPEPKIRQLLLAVGGCHQVPSL